MVSALYDISLDYVTAFSDNSDSNQPRAANENGPIGTIRSQGVVGGTNRIRNQCDSTVLAFSHEDRAMIAVASVLTQRNAGLRAKFKALTAQWKECRETYSSLPEAWAMAMPYQKIIAIGPEAITLILEELQHEPDHWFWALHVLTDADPVDDEDAGDFAKMTAAWIDWGIDNGFLANQNSQ